MVQPQTPASTDVNTRETYSLISADKVEGTSVYSLHGDKMGSIYRVMIDKRSGHVPYAVMSFGGFLGIGSKYHPIPWSMLTYDEELDGYRVDLSREELEGAPAYEENELMWSDPSFGTGISDYYQRDPDTRH